MSFIIDRQTLDDLNLTGKFRTGSVYNLFNKVVTAGGERLLTQMFHAPMTDMKQINERTALFGYVQNKHLNFSVTGEQFETVENYLDGRTGINRLASFAGIVGSKLKQLLLRGEDYDRVLEGVKATIKMLGMLTSLFDRLDDELFADAKAVLAEERVRSILNNGMAPPLSVWKLAQYDNLFRNVMRKEFELLMKSVCLLDVCIAVGKVADVHQLNYATALLASKDCLEASALWHPGLKNAVPNSVDFHRARNVLFLTGANMAGKSTFMKSVGIALYLAHCGFPVACRGMRFSVREGLYSSINVADNIGMGYSHFYAEVLRVKAAAEMVSSGRKMVVIFDELFKGTNVKDAYDATLAITAAFARYSGCCFIVSTHIIEVGEALAKRCDNIMFRYFPTVTDSGLLKYTYQLTEGISSDRQGMRIIRNEGVLEMIAGSGG